MKYFTTKTSNLLRTFSFASLPLVVVLKLIDNKKHFRVFRKYDRVDNFAQ